MKIGKKSTVLRAEGKWSILRMVSICMLRWTRSDQNFVLIQNCPKSCYFETYTLPCTNGVRLTFCPSYLIKQVRTTIGLADFLLPSSYIYLIYMGGNGACDSNTSLNIKLDVNRMFHVLKTPVDQFVLYGRYRTMWTDDSHFW